MDELKKNPSNRKPISYSTEFRLDINLNNFEGKESCAAMINAFQDFCLSVSLYLCLSVSLPLCLSVFLTLCLSVSLSLCLSVFLTLWLSVCSDWERRVGRGSYPLAVNLLRIRNLSKIKGGGGVIRGGGYEGRVGTGFLYQRKRVHTEIAKADFLKTLL